MDSTEPKHEPTGEGLPADATELLNLAQSGDDQASERLLGMVYEQLRATAGSYFRAQAANHTLQPTALVHEAYLKIVGGTGGEWESRGHFCAVASIAMRQILRDHARAKQAAKRGGGSSREPLTLVESPSGTNAVDLIALNDLLDALAETDERGARVVEMRYFGGMKHEQIAEVLDVSLRTVERTSRRCLAWMQAEMSEARTYGANRESGAT
ncbi:MAG: sigma-70 family RNA polymerase sigma factor [Planctomycetota bacterium]